MGSFSLSGGVEVFGFISPSNTADQYPVIDPLYGIDGLRNVDLLSDLDTIPSLRRRAGMVVGVSGGTSYYKLNQSPWTFTSSDWEVFNSSGGSFTGGTVTGDTIFTNGLTATTFSASTYQNLPLDVFVTGGTFSGGVITFENNSGGTFNVNGFLKYFISATTPSGATDGDRWFNTNDGRELVYVTDQDGSQWVVPNGTSSFFGSLSATTISATTISGGTFYGDGSNLIGISDVFVTGGTFSGGVITFVNNTGGTFTISGISSFDTFVTGGTYSTGTATFTNNSGGTFDVTGFSTSIGGTFTGGTVSGATQFLNGVTANTTLISGSAQNILTIIGSGSTSPLFTVQGSSGELFSVTDSLIGSLFSVNDISGLPIFEVFSDNTVLMGSYLAPSLNTTTRASAGTGLTNIYSIPTSAYTGAFFDYTVSDGTNLRAGNIMSIWSGTSVNLTEVQTSDFGNTSGITFNMTVSSGNAILRTSGTTSGWTVKTIVRSI